MNRKQTKDIVNEMYKIKPSLTPTNGKSGKASKKTAAGKNPKNVSKKLTHLYETFVELGFVVSEIWSKTNENTKTENYGFSVSSKEKVALFFIGTNSKRLSEADIFLVTSAVKKLGKDVLMAKIPGHIKNNATINIKNIK